MPDCGLGVVEFLKDAGTKPFAREDVEVDTFYISLKV